LCQDQEGAPFCLDWAKIIVKPSGYPPRPGQTRVAASFFRPAVPSGGTGSGQSPVVSPCCASAGPFVKGSSFKEQPLSDDYVTTCDHPQCPCYAFSAEGSACSSPLLLHSVSVTGAPSLKPPSRSTTRWLRAHFLQVALDLSWPGFFPSGHCVFSAAHLPTKPPHGLWLAAGLQSCAFTYAVGVLPFWFARPRPRSYEAFFLIPLSRAPELPRPAMPSQEAFLHWRECLFLAEDSLLSGPQPRPWAHSPSFPPLLIV